MSLSDNTDSNTGFFSSWNNEVVASLPHVPDYTTSTLSSLSPSSFTLFFFPPYTLASVRASLFTVFACFSSGEHIWNLQASGALVMRQNVPAGAFKCEVGLRVFHCSAEKQGDEGIRHLTIKKTKNRLKQPSHNCCGRPCAAVSADF